MLKRLAKKYRNIIIQCHDNPDADSICSGFALMKALRSEGADAALVYGGVSEISKPNLTMLIDALGIDIKKIDSIPMDTELLITVDCQRGSGNVTDFDLPKNAKVAIIDHHRPEAPENENTVIRPHLASCATVVWEMLINEGFELDRSVRTALFYGLHNDTNGLSELRHPLDRDLAELPNDAGIVRKLKNAAITIDELDIIGGALRGVGREIYKNIGLFKTEPCDTNLLGFTSDIAQQVAHLDCSVVYCEQKHGLKLSVRSSAREIMASEIAHFICKDAGSGGGGIEKAGGFMSFNKIYECSGGMAPDEYLRKRVWAYLDNYDLIYPGQHEIDFNTFGLYRKLRLPVGFVPSTDVYPAGAKITIRTLEGDIDTETSEGTYLMIGIEGEVYPINSERHGLSYDVTNGTYMNAGEYKPMIINRINGERKDLTAFARECVPKGDKLIRASALKRDAKVFIEWDTDKYYHGAKGDYLAANEDNHGDCYIIKKKIFHESYEPV